MKQSLLPLALLFIANSLALPLQGSKALISIPGSPSSLPLTRIEENYDVRAILEDSLLLVGDEEDFASIQSSYPGSTVVDITQPGLSYYLIERADLDDQDSFKESSWAFNTLQGIHSLGLEVILTTPRRFLVSSRLPLDKLFASYFSPDTELLLLPESKIQPAGQRNVNTLLELQRKFSRRADIERLVGQVDGDSLTEFNLYLSGERNDSSLNSRNSFSTDVLEAADWLADRFAAAGFKVDLEPFSTGYGPNVIAVLPGAIEPDRYVVIGAHFDSRATDRSSPTQRAPGANDDGTGTSILLEAARIISENNLKFRYSIVIGAWCGEEQGLVGSRAYAAKSKKEGLDIVAMIQGDMLAYRRRGERPQCAFPNRYHTPELTTLLKDVVRTYVPDVDVCDTGACCSDHQSFYEQGYASTQFFERCGNIADDQYHREGDLVYREGFDVQQWTYNAQAMFASLLTLAEVQ